MKDALLQVGHKSAGDARVDLCAAPTAQKHCPREAKHNDALPQNVGHVPVFDACVYDIAHEIRHEQRADCRNKKQRAVGNQPAAIRFQIR
ncbi:hypothetical protein SDC9_92284 [bioreactor metagenome]|uniref:Uncharacterized protein n=1 Tax=bioreactor metagenome TaxID=1076179 RepID=A0A644ZY10_9ZZZZ